MDVFLTLLRSFTRLQYLKVTAPTFITSRPTSEERAQGPPPPLRDLRLVSSTYETFGDYNEAAKLENFLSLSGATLTTIELRNCESSVLRTSIWHSVLSYDSISGGQGQRIFDLSEMVELTAVRLIVTKATQSIKILESLSSKKLEVLHLDFYLTDPREEF